MRVEVLENVQYMMYLYVQRSTDNVPHSTMQYSTVRSRTDVERQLVPSLQQMRSATSVSVCGVGAGEVRAWWNRIRLGQFARPDEPRPVSEI